MANSAEDAFNMAYSMGIPRNSPGALGHRLGSVVRLASGLQMFT